MVDSNLISASVQDYAKAVYALEARGAAVLLPVALIFVAMLANDHGLMGAWVNKRSTNVIGIAIIAFVSIFAAAYGIDSFLTTVHII